jgi:hypothetical protein
MQKIEMGPGVEKGAHLLQRRGELACDWEQVNGTDSGWMLKAVVKQLVQELSADYCR